MGQYFKVANLTKRQYFSAGIFDEEIKQSGILRGIHGYALGKLLTFGLPDLKSDWQMKAVDYGIQVGCWAGDRIAVIGDETGPEAGFLEVEPLNPKTQPIILDDILYFEFENIGGRLFCWMANDRGFKEWLVERLQKREGYLADVAYIAYKFPDLSRELISILDQYADEPPSWEYRCKQIWDRKSSFTPPEV
jgi:hypothetical protein